MSPLKLLFKPSTLEFFRQGRALGVSWFELIHGYFYARWPDLYIGAALGGRPMARLLLAPLFLVVCSKLPPFPDKDWKGPNFADSYHGKPMPLSEAKKLVTLTRPVAVHDLEKVIPYSLARELVLENPERIAVMRCPCRQARKNPCLPKEVCIVMGEPFVSFVLEHHPYTARALTQDEAVELLKAEDARGHVHHAFFKDALFGRFYAICNCCSCCCGAIESHRNGLPMLCSSGYVCSSDPQLCVGCGQCVEYCQFEALSVRDKKSAVDEDKCMGCGVCVSKCAKSALSLVRAPHKGEPLEVKRLLDQAGQSVSSAK